MHTKASADEAPDREPEAVPWSEAKCIGFRFTLAYFVIYNFPFPLSSIPLAEKVTSPYDRMWELVVPWVGAHVLHLATPITIFPGGSGDTTFNYVQLLCFLVIAIVVTIAWTLIAPRRTQYVVARDRLRAYLRYSLATTMLSYGAFKVIKSQFPSAGLERLVTPFGQFSPMGVLWSFMGYSYPYNVFTGMGEVVGGALLFFRKTTSLGAALLIAVLANVVLLNFAFDVPVKLFSAHLLLMALYLIAPDARRLFNVLVHNRAVGSMKIVPAVSPRWNRPRLALKALYCAIVLIWPFKQSRDNAQFFAERAKAPLFGLYDVDRFERNGVVVPPLLTDTTRWRQVIVAGNGRLSARLMNDAWVRFRLEADTSKRHLGLISPADSTQRWLFAYAPGDSGGMTIEGAMAGDSLRVVLRRIDYTKFLLLSRGYHWINEFPMNR